MSVRALRARVSQVPFVRRVWQWRADRRVARAAGTTAVGRASVRLLIAPANSAGQAYAWARAAERIEGVAAASFATRDPGDRFAFPVDHAVATALYRGNRVWRRAQQRAVRRRFTHVLVESGRPVLGTASTTGEQVAELRSHGIRVALLWHGSDIRSPGANLRRERDSPFAGAYEGVERLTQIVADNDRFRIASGAPSFVSTPDLLDEVPGATWLPVVVDPARWMSAVDREPLTRERPIVLHVPSSAGLKGTDLVSATMRRLHREGLIDYRELHGVAAPEMPAHYGGADIVLDQFALGIYGVAACEAMAAGRLVISHVSESVRGHVHRSTGIALPILESTAGDLEDTLRRVCADRDAARGLAAEGPAFVGEVHDGRRSAEALRSFLGR